MASCDLHFRIVWENQEAFDAFVEALDTVSELAEDFPWCVDVEDALKSLYIHAAKLTAAGPLPPVAAVLEETE